MSIRETNVNVASRDPSTLVARVITETLAPAVLAAAMPVITAVQAAEPLWRGLAWGLLTALFSAVIPFGAVVLWVRRGRLTDHHLGVRQQRRAPLLLGLASVLFGLLLLTLLGAPEELRLVVITMLAVLLGVTVVNGFWKLSAHAAVAAGSAVILILAFGVMAAGSVPLVALVGWSRVRLRDHTPGQVVAGTVVGALLALGVLAGPLAA